MKKLSTIILSLLIVGIIPACKSEKEPDNANIPPFEVTAETRIDEAVKLSCVDDTVILVGRANNFDAYIYGFDTDGKVLSESKINLSSGYLRAADIDGQGNIWLFHNHSEDTGKSITSANIDSYDSSGNYANHIELDISRVEDTDALASCNNLIAGDERFYLFSSAGQISNSVLFEFDRDGKLTAETVMYNGSGIEGIYRLTDERLVLKTFSPLTSSYSFAQIDLRADSSASKWVLNKENAQNVFYNTGFDDYSLLKCTENAVFGYNIETGESVPLVNWEQRGIYTAVRGYAAAFDDRYVFLLMKNPQNGKTIDLIRLAVTDDESAVIPATTQKKVTAAGFFIMDTQIKRAVDNFNGLNQDYKVELKDYYEQGNYENSLAKLTLDIMTGNAPDFMFFNDMFSVPRDSYAKKGLFADLYGFMDADPDIGREDYLPNVLAALETDGKLYFGATSFYITTLIGKTSDVGENMGWTWEDYRALLVKQPPGTIPFADDDQKIQKSRILYSILISKIADYVNLQTGTCDFVNTDFTKLLNMVANDFQQDPVGYSSVSDFSYGNPLLMQGSLFDFYSLRKWETAYFKEDVTFIGYPNNNGGTGSYGKFYNPFAITAKSDAVDGAWAFAKYLLNDCQKKSGTLAAALDANSYNEFGFGGFPIKKSELIRVAELSKTEGPDGKRVNDEYVIDKLNVNTDKQAEKILELVYSLTDFERHDFSVSGIILEEVEPFYAGQKTAEEVAAVIQNRVSLYLAEMG
jgi:ABC-type glycerol-3-phosphate transport system substrate-binding protein